MKMVPFYSEFKKLPQNCQDKVADDLELTGFCIQFADCSSADWSCYGGMVQFRDGEVDLSQIVFLLVGLVVMCVCFCCGIGCLVFYLWRQKKNENNV